MDRKIVVEMIFGSHLYGTDTPFSDRDYRGIVMPTVDELLLCEAPKSIKGSTKRTEGKNTKYDVDREWYSLHYFVSLGLVGDTHILDMLHAPPDMILQSSETWDRIVLNRRKFYNRRLKALVGYARRQAAKYGIKGSRLNVISDILKVLKAYPTDAKLQDIWDKLPTGEHIHILPSEDDRFQFYQVTGKKFMSTIKVQYMRECLENMYAQYGGRALDAAKNLNVDWKALSHAIRAALEVKELLEDNTITFPLKEREYVIAVKMGKLDYLTEVAPRLEALIDECEQLSESSTLPAKADREFWEEFVIDEYRELVNDSA